MTLRLFVSPNFDKNICMGIFLGVMTRGPYGKRGRRHYILNEDHKICFKATLSVTINNYSKLSALWMVMRLVVK
jgi:hypothetical protein